MRSRQKHGVEKTLRFLLIRRHHGRSGFHTPGECFAIGIETNGTIEPPDGMDWVCVSPKAGADLVVRRGHELKLVYPQAGAAPEDFAGLDFERFSLQPMDGPDVIENTARTIDYCLRHPQWRLSLQTHKTLGIR